MNLPRVKVAGYDLSRLVLGSNPFLGFSHFSSARDKWFRRYFTVDRMVEVMERCWELGVNAIVGPADEKLFKALKGLKEALGDGMVWISTTYGSPSFEQQEREVRWLAERKAEICLIHCGFTDTHLIHAERKVHRLEELLKLIRSLGMAPGVSTHRPEAIITCDEAGYDIEAYIIPINIIGFLCPVEIGWLSSVIKKTSKTVISIKPLASGRITPYEGLSYSYNAIKDKDVVAVGVSSIEEAEEDIGIAKQIFERRVEASEAELPYSPSKSILTPKA